MSGATKPKLRLVGQAEKADPIFGGRPKDELEFLPAALEVIETPTPPLPRVAALSVVGLLLVSLAWAAFSKVDIIATAPGRLVPSGGGKVVQPLETGTITSIRVHDGSVVHQGDVLVELEPTETLADQQQVASELVAAELDVARLKTVALGAPFRAPPGADPTAAAIAEKEAKAELADRNAKLSSLTQQMAEHQAELAGSRAAATRLQTILPLDQQSLRVFEDLQKKGFGSKLQLIQAQEKAADTAQQLDVEREHIPQYQAAVAASERDRAEADADAAKTDLASLTEAQVKVASLQDQLSKASERHKDKTLVAPVDGAVQELAIHTIGGVVEPGQTLMRIAPGDAGLEVEARLENKDVGFVRVGMPAEVKIEAFPFTRYGVIHASVTDISRDAVAEAPAKQPDASSMQPSDTADDLHYLVHMRLDRDTINIDGKQIGLTPGMMITAEIKTGKRRVLDYILSPLAKSTSEAAHER